MALIANAPHEPPPLIPDKSRQPTTYIGSFSMDLVISREKGQQSTPAQSFRYGTRHRKWAHSAELFISGRVNEDGSRLLLMLNFVSLARGFSPVRVPTAGRRITQLENSHVARLEHHSRQQLYRERYDSTVRRYAAQDLRTLQILRLTSVSYLMVVVQWV